MRPSSAWCPRATAGATSWWRPTVGSSPSVTRVFAGSCPGIGGCAGSAVSVVPDATGNGYWVVTNIGAVYTFGDAVNYGAPGPQSSSMTSAVATPERGGLLDPRRLRAGVPLRQRRRPGWSAARHGGRIRPCLGHLRDVRRRRLLGGDGTGQGVRLRRRTQRRGHVGHHLNGPIIAASGSSVIGRPPAPALGAGATTGRCVASIVG